MHTWRRHSEEQREIAEAKLDVVRKGGRKIELHMAPVTDVYRAEEYHQRYYAKANKRSYGRYGGGY